jgi:uncharacterized protein
MTKAEYAKRESTSINHFHEKLFKIKVLMNTETAKQIAEQREKFMRDFVNQFMEEWSGIR